MQKHPDRSWKLHYVVLKSNVIYLCKDKRSGLLSPELPPLSPTGEQGPSDMSGSSSVLEEIRLDVPTTPTDSGGGKTTVEIADDYTKRKCVFRVKTSAGSECLFQVKYPVQ